MKHYALVNSEGHTIYTLSGTEMLGLVHGQIYEGNLCVEVEPNPVDDSYYMESVYYDHDLNDWQPKTPCPGVQFYSWVDKAWQFMPDLFLTEVRKLRDAKLVESDWTQMPDVPLTTQQKEDWQVYRQALRDITENLTATTIEEIVWPASPQ